MGFDIVLACRTAIMGLLLFFFVPTIMVSAQTSQTGQGGGGWLVDLFEQIGARKFAKEFAYNGTSFDEFLKERVIPTYGKDYILNNMSNQSAQAEAMKSVTMCISPLGQAFGGIGCDFALSTLHEICEVLPEAIAACASPAVDIHLASRNVTEGQTDKMVWLLIDNPYLFTGGYSNSTNLS